MILLGMVRLFETEVNRSLCSRIGRHFELESPGMDVDGLAGVRHTVVFARSRVWRWIGSGRGGR